MSRSSNEILPEQEAKHRFEAALRGAREVGHEAMKDIPPKRRKSEMNAGVKANPPKKRASKKEII